jgi:hypothetical protein
VPSKEQRFNVVRDLLGKIGRSVAVLVRAQSVEGGAERLLEFLVCGSIGGVRIVIFNRVAEYGHPSVISLP